MKSTLKIFIVLFVILGASCKKDENFVRKNMTYLNKAGWLTLKTEEKTSNGGWNDVTGTANKDVLFFYRNGDYTILGTTNLTGKWMFVDNGKKIQILDGGNLMEILTLDDNTLEVLITKTAPAADVRYTFGHP